MANYTNIAVCHARRIRHGTLQTSCNVDPSSLSRLCHCAIAIYIAFKLLPT